MKNTGESDQQSWFSGKGDIPRYDERDSCAIVAAVRKGGAATHGNMRRVLNALSKMGHRSGDVNGEGDGCGILTDIPRLVWADRLAGIGKPAWLAEDQRFFVGHVLIPGTRRSQSREVGLQLDEVLRASGADVFINQAGETRSNKLGRRAREQEPVFWQVAGLMSDVPLDSVEQTLFRLIPRIEGQLGLHVSSLSSHSVVYKVRGTVETLYHYFPELHNPKFMTAITLGHARYSTNTSTVFERVQPFNFLGHNGEINTIARLREQAQMLGAELVEAGSDSQDLDRTIGTLIHHYGFSLAEAMEMVQPPILSEIQKMPENKQKVYRRYRQAFGPFAQGPAALIVRQGDECAFCVDALGLRPLWFGETEKEYYFASEKGVYFLDSLCNDPRPLSPGEKMVLHVNRNQSVDVLEYPDVQDRVMVLTQQRLNLATNEVEAPLDPGNSGKHPIPEPRLLSEPLSRLMPAFGWGREDRDWVKALADIGSDPISSLGYDKPLAALSQQRKNISDYFKEAVAVVTNPAIDREREQEHFSTQVLLGPRQALTMQNSKPAARLAMPVLIENGPENPALSPDQYQELAETFGTRSIAELTDQFDAGAVLHLELVTWGDESARAAIQRLAESAVEAVRSGAQLVILDDSSAFLGDAGWVEPFLAIAVIDRALRSSFDESDAGEPVNLRRQTGLVLRTGAARNLHDLIMLLGLGADAVSPYLLIEVGLDDPGRKLEAGLRFQRMRNLYKALQAGVEKVTSTMGIHELRGYGRLFASIGLSEELAQAMGTVNYFGSESHGLTWEALEAEIQQRKSEFTGGGLARLSNDNHLYSRVWKSAAQVSMRESTDVFEIETETMTKDQPVALRHILDFCLPDGPSLIDPESVDAGLTGHDLPFVIASMSFGSQGETAFRAYAEGAYRLNMICMNGEGGEIADMLGKYPHNRGQQIASGRFGVDINLVNSSNLLEIKIGQGAKPGEGGHLPGKKVSQKVAAARHASPGVDLISPSNNHDIYSIEDLSQFIEELKTANPKARVAVKVPVVPGIGIIAVGIAKAGADIINLTGFEGGTGAARKHSLKHVGLPAEIGVAAAHRELTEAGLRQRVEIWCDGGMRTAADVVKMICLGANRVGFGTLAMVAAGCTICRSCQTDTCHVGIATQLETLEQAQAHGLRKFAPRDFEQAVRGIESVFGAIGKHVRQITARLGFERTQDLVGRTDLLLQISHFNQIDAAALLAPASAHPEPLTIAHPLPLSTGIQLSRHPLRRPRNHLTTVISNMVMEAALVGEEVISFEDDKISPVDRALGTHLSGAISRYKRGWTWEPGHNGVGGLPETWHHPSQSYLKRNGNGGKANGNGNGHHPLDSRSQGFHLCETNLHFYASSVPGNGLGAYATEPMNIFVEGGAQDGVGKGMNGGKLVIMKGYNHNGIRVDGSVGKGLAYGAMGGLIIVQGNADSRACIRLSGADVILGGEIRQPLRDELGYLGARANIKGFLCEYMTAGRVLVLGDPGPWICAGMTGGVLYLRLQPQLGFDLAAVQRRIALGAKVNIQQVDSSDEANLSHLLRVYADELRSAQQTAAADQVLEMLGVWQREFVKIVPVALQADQSVSLE